MKLLAINTSGISASIALGYSLDFSNAPKPGFEEFVDQVPQIEGSDFSHQHKGRANDDNVDATATPNSLKGFHWKCIALEPEEKTAESLVPRIRDVLDAESIPLSQLDVLAVATGPGSFTGLRIGITTVKSLAYVINRPVAAVNSLAAMAQNAIRMNCWSSGKMTIIVNAFRRQFFVATLDRSLFESAALKADDLTKTIDQKNLAEYVERENSLFVGGPGVENIDSATKAKLGDRIIETELNDSAQGIGELASLNAYPFTDSISLLPKYFRGSAAEEKLSTKS